MRIPEYARALKLAAGLCCALGAADPAWALACTVNPQSVSFGIMTASAARERMGWAMSF